MENSLPLKNFRKGNPFRFHFIMEMTVVSVILLFTACSKEDFQPDLEASQGWEPEIAVPLAYSEIGIQDLAHVNDSTTNLVVDNNQFCTLIYEGTIFDIAASQLFQLPDQSLQNQFSLNNPEILTLTSTGQVQVTSTEDIAFSLSQGATLDSMLLKNGQVVVELNSDFPADADILITIPSMIKNGVSFSSLVSLDYNGTIPIIENRSISLSGYHIDLTKNGTTSSTLTVIYTMTIKNPSGAISNSNTIQHTIGFQALQYNSIYGYLGQQIIGNLQDSIELSIYQNAIGVGSFSIMDPLFQFDIGNSAGIPLLIRITQLKALQSNLTGFTMVSGIPDPIPVQTPSISQEGQMLHSNFILSKSNSNISSIISDQPHYMIAASQVSTNPSGVTTNFLSDSSRITMNAKVELPLYGTASDFRIRDTVPFNYSDLEKVEQLTLKVNVENWFPIDAGIKLVFTDSNFQALDTVFMQQEPVIPSGIITGAEERVTIAGRETLEEIFDAERISKILNATNIIVDASASTINQGTQNVKIFSDYRLKLKFGAIVKLKIF